MASDGLIKVLEAVSPAFAGVLKRLNTREWDITADRCFDISDKGEISYLPKGKECQMEGNVWGQLHRQTGKTGRMFKKLPIVWDSDQELEQIAHDISSYYIEPEIMMLSGKDIIKYYDEAMYLKKAGTLGDSCMRYERCAPYLKIYSENPERVQLAVLTKGDKIIARTLVWKLNNGETFMDRVYYTDEVTKNVMLRWAAKNGYWYKQNQNNEPGGQIVTPSGTKSQALFVTLEKADFPQYPYMDTFRFLNVEGKVMSNVKNLRSLSSTGGGYDNV